MHYQPLIVQDTPYRAHIGRDTVGYLHWHSEMELLICLSGYLWVDAEDRQFTLREGDALVLPGYVAHSAHSDCAAAWRVAVNFGYGLLKKGYPSVQNACVYIPAEQENTPEGLRAPIEALTQIFRMDGQISRSNHWRIRANLLLLCAYLQDTAPAQVPTGDLQSRIRRLDSIYTVLDYVAKHYRRKITVEDMASLAGYAKTYFCKQFKQIIGIPFYRYLTCYRISVACMLLEEPRHSMSAIADMTGFSTQALFCRAFREITGMTPSQFQSLPREERTMTWMS